MVWNETLKMEIMRIECGGSHRNWAYSPPSNTFDGGSFVWTKASSCNVYTQPQTSHRIVHAGGHGREIKALASSPKIMTKTNASPRYLASGAEDTAIRIFELDDSQKGTVGCFKCLHVMPKHIAGVQKLQWSSNGHFLFSAGGQEELFVWRIQPVPCFHIGLVCDSKCPLITQSAVLRVMDFEALEITGQSSLESYIVSVVYSDSSIRVGIRISKIFCEQLLTDE